MAARARAIGQRGGDGGGVVSDWSALCWPAGAAGAAMAAAARAAGLSPRHVDLEAPPEGTLGDLPALSRFLECAAHVAGIESEPVSCRHEGLRRALGSIGAALVRLRAPDGFRWLAVATSSPERLRVVTPTGRTANVPLEALHGELTTAMDAEPGMRVDKWLERANVPEKRARRARRQLVDYLLAERTVDGMWLLREDPGSSFARQLRRRGLLGLATRFVLASVAQVAMAIGGWAMIARGALQGVVEAGWLAGWALLCLSVIPLQAMASQAAGELGVLVATRLKQRLLCGALRLPPAEVRARGAGGLLALVSESQAIDGAGFAGALRCLTGLVQLCAAGAVLAAGAGGWLHVALLAGWVALAAGGGHLAMRARAAWTERRFELTNGFVENVIGNRTRVVQQRRQRHHARDDARSDGYLHAASAMDRWNEAVGSLAGRGWVALGLLGLVHATATREPSVAEVAIAVAGILQASLALGTLVPAWQQLQSAGVAYRSVGTLFRAAARRDEPGVPELVSTPAGSKAARGESVLAMHGVVFQFGKDTEPVLQGCHLDLRGGDRVLCEGRSGEGKSTLAALASGLLAPSAGLVLLRGLDRPTLGSTAWRQRVASAPQFHDNHILSGTLAFNLLMGRAWPPSEADLAEADTLCRRIGLGPMLDRMPSKLHQVVGETGWQLSHGERSRVFLARALLQHADVVILDECFGALDPETLARCVGVVRSYAPTLMVIAHP